MKVGFDKDARTAALGRGHADKRLEDVGFGDDADEFVFPQDRQGADAVSALDARGLLNRTVESCPSPRMSLHTVQARQTGADAQTIEAIRALRNDRTHGEQAKNEQTRRGVETFKQLSPVEQAQVFRRAIAVISRACSVTSLKPLLEKHL